jgi:hypothetical protein
VLLQVAIYTCFLVQRSNEGNKKSITIAFAWGNAFGDSDPDEPVNHQLQCSVFTFTMVPHVGFLTHTLALVHEGEVTSASLSPSCCQRPLSQKFEGPLRIGDGAIIGDQALERTRQADLPRQPHWARLTPRCPRHVRLDAPCDVETGHSWNCVLHRGAGSCTHLRVPSPRAVRG